MDNPQVKIYYKYYSQQHGGDFPVFRGTRYQTGAGFGDILRGIFRTVAPIALRGLGAFIGATAKAKSDGASLGDAAKSALKPALSAVMSGAADAFNERQAGNGNRKSVYKGKQKGVGKKPALKREKSPAKTSKSKKVKKQKLTNNTHYNF